MLGGSILIPPLRHCVGVGMSNQRQPDANNRINGFIERIAFAAITVGVSVTATFQWQLYKDSADIRALLKQHDSRLSMLEQRQAEIMGTMVGWDVLKRIELYMSNMTEERPQHTEPGRRYTITGDWRLM